MITLADIFDDLSTGELSQFSFSGAIDAPGGIQPSDYPTLVRHTNRALVNLFTRFCLKEREVTIGMHDEISFYILDSKYAQSNTDSGELIKWIEDTPENPFTNDILRIQEVYNEVGDKLPINDLNQEDSVFLPTYKTLQIPNPASDDSVFVTYRAKHTDIPIDADPETTEVEIPVYCVEPLLTYIAYRVYSTNADHNIQQIAASLMAKYEYQCKELEDKNVLYNTPNETNLKLMNGGWI